MPGRTLVVTNDFPPRTGGIESFVLAISRLLPPDQVVVHTARQRGDAELDATLPFPVVRDPSRLMVPTPAITRRVAAHGPRARLRPGLVRRLGAARADGAGAARGRGAAHGGDLARPRDLVGHGARPPVR